jgi:large subunit ribosomal protein L18e
VKQIKATNPELLEVIDFLKKQRREKDAEIWWTIAERLAKPRGRGLVVNLSRLNRFTRRSETVAVAGKVLATGKLSHPVTVAAFAFSARAREKITAARGKCLSFFDLIKKNPKGSNVKIIG